MMRVKFCGHTIAFCFQSPHLPGHIAVISDVFHIL